MAEMRDQGLGTTRPTADKECAASGDAAYKGAEGARQPDYWRRLKPAATGFISGYYDTAMIIYILLLTHNALTCFIADCCYRKK
jgi:hypothetical protein